ncbi:oocyte zinc finger protein XlCOF7.1-like isoform X2 [Gigantopelta aegis]|uniref:oocyte zinc finger protein XlCOF7.1-like isoform X2 n=1 Tax=Gigantopelta aegis TaxID=1735272 RepID=UPI001B88A96F|nr:oocyte zinc finger protein XlCOF7.1-like isoform X2 [Gigantopelta aegis]
MDDNNLSAFLEKVNGVETAFTLLVCSERECAVTSLETLLNKLKCLLKVKELTNNKQKCIKSEHGEEENNKTSTELDTRPRKRRSNRTACSQTSKQTTRSKIPKLAPKEKENKIKEEISVQDSSNARTRKKRNSLQKNNLVSIATRRSGRGTKKKAVADVDSVTHEDQSGINDTVDSEIDENDVDHHPLENSTTPVLENRVTSSRSRGASSQRRLSRHLVNNSKDTDELSLEETRTSTTNKRVHKCKKCGESFTSNHLMKSHFRVHGLSSLACRFCRKVMMNEVALLHHKCAETRRKRTCRICGDTRQFETFSDLREHMRMEHDKLSTPGDAIHTCSYCPRTFSRKVALFMHLKVHAGNQFVCLKCGLFLEDKDAYASHMTEHYADAQFRCQICKSSFRQQRLYYSHMDNHQKYDCKDCSRPFTCWRDLRRHRKIEHGEKYEAKLKSYECEDCHRKFLKENQLEIHRRIHTGERPLQCSLCQLFFRTQKALHKHKQTYKHSLLAGDTVKERKYLCSQCGKAYFRKQALQRHLKQLLQYMSMLKELMYSCMNVGRCAGGTHYVKMSLFLCSRKQALQRHLKQLLQYMSMLKELMYSCMNVGRCAGGTHYVKMSLFLCSRKQALQRHLKQLLQYMSMLKELMYSCMNVGRCAGGTHYVKMSLFLCSRKQALQRHLKQLLQYMSMLKELMYSCMNVGRCAGGTHYVKMSLFLCSRKQALQRHLKQLLQYMSMLKELMYSCMNVGRCAGGTHYVKMSLFLCSRKQALQRHLKQLLQYMSMLRVNVQLYECRKVCWGYSLC